MYKTIISYISLFFVLLLSIFGCKTKEKSTNIQNEYFEFFSNKVLVRGHYSPYFVLDGNKEVVRINLDQTEIVIEGEDLSKDFRVDSISMRKYNVLIIKGRDDYYKMNSGYLQLDYPSSDVIELKIDLIGTTNVWLSETESNSGNADDLSGFNFKYEGRIGTKVVNSP